MADSLRGYPEYRASGIEWLGDIPAHWETTSTKRRYEIQLGKMLQGSQERTSEKPVPYLKAINVQWFATHSEDLPMMWASPEEITKYEVRNGDLLVCEGGEGGRCAIASHIPNQCIIQNAVHRVRARHPNSVEFLGYVLYCVSKRGWFDAVNNKATISHFTLDKFGALGIPFPPPDERAAIVRFLDEADRRIRRYIRAKQKLIKLLNERKQAIIQQAVTRGLDPDLPMKDSGVEWLGDIPAHWEMKRAKYAFRESDIRSSTGQEELLSVSHLTGVTPRSQKNVTMFKSASYIGSKLCDSGDLVINTMWAWMGALGVAHQPGIVSPSYGVYRLLQAENFLPQYLDYLLRTKSYIAEYIRRSTGIRSSRLRLYSDEFLKIPIVKPSRDEQQAILEHIERETEAINGFLADTQSEIDLIREYRTRLIFDVVTGKVDVRGLAFEMPEAFEADDLSAVDDEDDTADEIELKDDFEEITDAG